MLNITSNITSENVGETVFEALVVGAISTLAVAANVSLFLVILTSRQLRNESNVLILSLSLADLLVSAISMPLTTATVVFGTWKFSRMTCIAVGYINMLTFTASVQSLAVISVNRYVKICRPSRFVDIYTYKNVLVMCTGVWLVSGMTSVPPLLGWAAYSYIPNSFICFCEWSRSPSYAFFMIGFCFCLPCSVMIFCNFRILRAYINSKRAVDNFADRNKSGRNGLVLGLELSGSNEEKGNVHSKPVLQFQNGFRPEMSKDITDANNYHGVITQNNDSIAINKEIDHEIAVSEEIDHEIVVSEEIGHEIAVSEEIDHEIAVSEEINQEIAVKEEIDHEIVVSEEIDHVLGKKTKVSFTDNSTLNNSSKCFVFSQDSLPLVRSTSLTSSVINMVNDYHRSIPVESERTEAETSSVKLGRLIEADVKSDCGRRQVKLIDDTQIGNTTDQLSLFATHEHLPRTMSTDNLHFPLACNSDSEAPIMAAQRNYAGGVSSHKCTLHESTESISAKQDFFNITSTSCFKSVSMETESNQRPRDVEKLNSITEFKSDTIHTGELSFLFKQTEKVSQKSSRFSKVWTKIKSNKKANSCLESLETERIGRNRAKQTTSFHCVISTIDNNTPVAQQYQSMFKILKSKKLANRKLFQKFRSNRRKRKVIRVFPFQQNTSDMFQIDSHTSLMNSIYKIRCGHDGFQSTEDSKLDLVGQEKSVSNILLQPSVISSTRSVLDDKQLECLSNKHSDCQTRIVLHTDNVTLVEPLDDLNKESNSYIEDNMTLFLKQNVPSEVNPSTSSVNYSLPLGIMTSSLTSPTSVKRDLFLSVPSTKPGDIESRPADKIVQVKTKSSKNLNSKTKFERRRREEFQLAGSLLVMIMLFIVCWFPYCVSMFVSIFSPSLSSRSLDLTSLCLGYFNSCLNPIIYGAMNKKFKDGYKRLLLSAIRPFRFKKSWDVRTESSRRHLNNRWTLATVTST